MGDNVAGWEQLDYREEQRTDEGVVSCPTRAAQHMTSTYNDQKSQHGRK